MIKKAYLTLLLSILFAIETNARYGLDKMTLSKNDKKSIDAAWDDFWSLPESERIKKDMHYAAFKNGGDNIVIKPDKIIKGTL